jgi:hypothetical protein
VLSPLYIVGFGLDAVVGVKRPVDDAVEVARSVLDQLGLAGNGLGGVFDRSRTLLAPVNFQL